MSPLPANALPNKLAANVSNDIRRFRVTSVTLFISDCNALSCELDNFTFKMLY